MPLEKRRIKGAAEDRASEVKSFTMSKEHEINGRPRNPTGTLTSKSVNSSGYDEDTNGVRHELLGHLQHIGGHHGQEDDLRVLGEELEDFVDLVLETASCQPRQDRRS